MLTFNSWGVYLQTASGFLATENSFNTTTTTTNNYTFGMVVNSGNLIQSEVYKMILLAILNRLHKQREVQITVYK